MFTLFLPIATGLMVACLLADAVAASAGPGPTASVSEHPPPEPPQKPPVHKQQYRPPGRTSASLSTGQTPFARSPIEPRVRPVQPNPPNAAKARSRPAANPTIGAG